MLKCILFCAVVLLASHVQATQEPWCAWDGQEYVKKMMNESGKHWLQVVSDLHNNGSDINEEDVISVVGSCRFLKRGLGTTSQDVIEEYLKSYTVIIPSRAYLKVDGGVEIILPQAFYTAGTNQLVVFKDFYSTNRPLCEKQKQEMKDLGEQSQGIRFADVSTKRNTYGGISVILNEQTPGASYLGVCYFH